MADIVTNTLQIGGNNLILQDAAVRASIAPEYSSSSTYAVGDMVLKDGQLYECNTAISTAEAWTAAHWTAVTVGGELATVKDGLNEIEDITFYVSDTEETSVQTASGWRLNESDGLCTQNANYKLVKFNAVAGTYLRITTDDRFQFQNSQSVPATGTSNRIGKTYQAGTHYVLVPSGATFLIVSTLISDGSISVKKSEPITNTVTTIMDGISVMTEFPFNTVEGYVNGDGIIVSTANNRSTDGIAVKAGEMVAFHFSIPTAQSCWIAYATYDSTSTFISRTVLANSITGDSFDFDVSIPSGTSYIIFTYPYVANSIVTISKAVDVAVESLDNKYSYDLSVATAGESSVDLLNDILWTKGTVDGSTGVPTSSGNIIRTAKYIPVKGCSSISLKRVNTVDVYYCRVFYYDGNYTYISGSTAWITTDSTNAVPVNASFALFILYNNTRNAITPSEGIHLSAKGNPKIVDELLANNEVLKELKNARHIANSAVEPFTILQFSDIHQDSNSLESIVNDATLYAEDVDDIICTGDIRGNDGGEIASWWNPKVMTCIGNHDSAVYSGGSYNWTGVSMAQRDSWYIAPFESNWSITHTSGTSYYYKDYTTQKIRLIVMDVMLYTGTIGTEANAQTAWLENLLGDAITNNLHVLIAIHAPHGGSSAFECSFSRYDQGTMPTLTDCDTPQSIIDVVGTAIGNGLKFVGYIVGHTHQDNVWIAAEKQLMYCVTCAAVTQVAQWENSDQDRSLALNAYNLITIDTTHSLVKIVRGGGADIDDHMRTRKAICFDYSTGTKVGEVL